MTPEDLARLLAEESELAAAFEAEHRFNQLSGDKQLLIVYLTTFLELGRSSVGHSVPEDLYRATLNLLAVVRTDAQLEILKFLYTKILPDCSTRTEHKEAIFACIESTREALNGFEAALDPLLKKLHILEPSPSSPKHEPEVTRNEPK